MVVFYGIAILFGMIGLVLLYDWLEETLS